MRELRFLLCAFCSAIAPLLAVQMTLEFGAQNATYRAVLPLRNGTRLLVGSAPRSANEGTATQRMVLTILGDAMSTGPNFGGSGKTVPSAAVLDASGNVWIAGTTDSDDFLLKDPLVSGKLPYREAGFLAELDATGQTLLFATFLGAERTASTRDYAVSIPTALASDAAGNIYAGGATLDPAFPTAGGYSDCQPLRTPFGDTTTCAFVLKISPARKLLYGALLKAEGRCTGSLSGCIGQNRAYGTVDSLAVDATGAVTASGALGGSYDRSIAFTYPGRGYICRLSADGTRLVWMLYISDAVRLMVAQDAAGRVSVFGRAIPVVPSSTYPPYARGDPILFAGQVQPDGSGLASRFDLAQSSDANLAGILADRLGNLYLSGTSSSSSAAPLDVAGTANLGADFLLTVDPSGVPVRPALRLPRGAIAAAPAFDAAGALSVPGAGGALLTVPVGLAVDGPPSVVAFANAASAELNAGLFPGSLMTLYGFNLPGREQGLRVEIDGLAAPILTAGPNRIDVQVPFRIRRYPLRVRLAVSPGAWSTETEWRQSIGLFTSDGVRAAALNSDGSVNSPANPAAAGSVLSLFGTGAMWPSGMTDGAVAPRPSAIEPALNRLEVFDAVLTPWPILYAGAAPGLVNGVFQLNLLLPPTASNRVRTRSLQVKSRTDSGMLTSNTVEVFVQ